MSWVWIVGGAVVLTALEAWWRNRLHASRPELGEGWSEEAVEQLRREALIELRKMEDVRERAQEADWQALVREARLEARAWDAVDDHHPFGDQDAGLMHALRTGEDVDVEALRTEATEQRRRADALHERVLALMRERDELIRALRYYEGWGS